MVVEHVAVALAALTYIGPKQILKSRSILKLVIVASLRLLGVIKPAVVWLISVAIWLN